MEPLFYAAGVITVIPMAISFAVNFGISFGAVVGRTLGFVAGSAASAAIDTAGAIVMLPVNMITDRYYHSRPQLMITCA